MTRIGVKTLFVLTGLVWLGFTTFELAFGSMGNCAAMGFVKGVKAWQVR